MTVTKMHKVGMLALAKMLEKVEQSGFPISISKLNLKPRAGEPDSYEVELGLSAFERKADEPKSGAATPGASATATPSAAPKEETP
jgi:general secretion pathway protein M